MKFTRWRFELVQDAKNWWKWWSMRFTLVSLFCSGAIAAYVVLPADFLPEIPVWFKQTLGITAVLSAGAAAVTRPIRQHKLD